MAIFSTTTSARRAARAAALGFAAGSLLVSASAQTVYRYRGPDGEWVYTDRRPSEGQAFEERSFAPSLERPEVKLLRRDMADGTILVARNTYHAPVEIAWRLTRMENLIANAREADTKLVPARSDVELMALRRADPAEPMTFEYEFKYLPGAPAAEHRPEQPYRLPYALASSFPVSQAFPDTLTHREPSSQHAVDFAMPIGTGVYAAREGVVIDVASDFFEAGLDPDEDGPRANFVRVLHSDGTMGLYAHLNWNSIRVVPGQRVGRGEYLADSGNTGFSTGPHLHFVVQRNAGGRLVSVPIEFAGVGGRPMTVRRGERPVAYR